MDVYAQIREAMLDRQQVVADYRGHTREMCPHVLGTKDGRRQALFYQFGGGSESGLPEGGEWRCIPVDELTSVSVRLGDWYSGSPGSRLQTCVDIIELEVMF